MKAFSKLRQVSLKRGFRLGVEGEKAEVIEKAELFATVMKENLDDFKLRFAIMTLVSSGVVSPADFPLKLLAKVN